jgi:hypothetical protein
MSDETAAPKLLTVSLDASVAPHVLKVDGNADVGKHPANQRITWTLDDSLAGFRFKDMEECRPGFEWLSWPAPKPGIFDTARVVDKGRGLEIRDTHNDSGSDGTWLYRLRVERDGVEYETVTEVEGVVEPPGSAAYMRLMVGNNPVIINR